ncbi:MAG: biotin/lipoyl-containing protein, partial [Solirubrobacteraceae bacterium]
DKKWLKRLAFPVGDGPVAPTPPADGGDAENLEQTYEVEVSGKRFDVRVLGPPLGGGVVLGAGAQNGGGARKAPKRGERKSSSHGGPDTLPSPLQGNMWKVLVKQGDEVQEGQLLCIIEAMKMENEITAHKSGTITELPITEGAPIQAGAPIATILSANAS